MGDTDGMSPFSIAGAPPIPGTPIDPPPKSLESSLTKADDKRRKGLGVLSGALARFSYAEATLLSAGTAYYAFIALFSILVAAFGIAALWGGEGFAEAVSAAMSKAFPGLESQPSISAESLQSAGQATSIGGIVLLLFSGSTGMVAMSKMIHTIFGAPKDSRNFLSLRLRMIAWMFLLIPLMGMSFLPSAIVTDLAQSADSTLDVTSDFVKVLIVLVTLVVSLLLNFLVIWIILSHFGGIRSSRKSRMVGAVFGAIGIEVLKYLLTSIISWSLSRPQYGAFAAPIAMMLVLFLEAIVLCLSASITASTADREADPDAGDQPAKTDKHSSGHADAKAPSAQAAPEVAD